MSASLDGGEFRSLGMMMVDGEMEMETRIVGDAEASGGMVGWECELPILCMRIPERLRWLKSERQSVDVQQGEVSECKKVSGRQEISASYFTHSVQCFTHHI